MGTFQLSAIDMFDDVAASEDDGLRTAGLGDLRACRSTNCDDLADHGDEFCPRCRDEIDALREMRARGR